MHAVSVAVCRGARAEFPSMAVVVMVVVMVGSEPLGIMAPLAFLLSLSSSSPRDGEGIVIVEADEDCAIAINGRMATVIRRKYVRRMDIMSAET